MRFAEDLSAYGAADGSARMEGRNAHILISPVKVQPPPKSSSKAGAGESTTPAATS